MTTETASGTPAARCSADAGALLVASCGLMTRVTGGPGQERPGPSRAVPAARSEARVLQHLGNERRDRRPLRPDQGDMREQRVAFELLDDGDYAIVAPNSQIVALSDVMGEHHPGASADPGQDGQQH